MTGRPTDDYSELPATTPLVNTVAHQGEADVQPEPIVRIGPDGMDSDGD